MIAEILKVDEGTAARLFGDPMELRRMQREEKTRAEQMKNFTTATTKLKEAFEQMFLKIEPILTAFTTGIGWLAETFGDLVTTSSVVLAFFAKLAYSFKAVGAWLGTLGKGLAVLKTGFSGLLVVGALITTLIEGWQTGDWLYAGILGVSSLAGAAIGAALGSWAGPPGMLIGSIIGGMLGTSIGKWATGGPDASKAAPERVGDMVSTPGTVYKGLAGDGYAMKKDESGKLRVAAMGTKIPHGMHEMADVGGSGGAQNPKIANRITINLDGNPFRDMMVNTIGEVTNPNRLRGIQSSAAAMGRV